MAPDQIEHVILVDEADNELGTMEKMEAHRKGRLHRAFSVVLFNATGEMLLQKRSAHKYHSAGLWTNTCCSHPLPGEPMQQAIRRRLRQEMGIDLQPEYLFKFRYQAQLDNNLIEHEVDHVFTGIYNGPPAVNAEEVADWKYIQVDELRRDIELNPDRYTYWFRKLMTHESFSTPVG